MAYGGPYQPQPQPQRNWRRIGKITAAVVGGLFLFFLILGLLLPKPQKDTPAANTETVSPSATVSTFDTSLSTPASTAAKLAATTAPAGPLAPAASSPATVVQSTTRAAAPATQQAQVQPVHTDPAPAPAPQQQAPPPATTQPADVYYANCSAARAAGAAPLYQGQPGYRSGLDRDGDGVACET